MNKINGLRVLLLLCLLLLSNLRLIPQSIEMDEKKNYNYKNPSLSVGDRVIDLLERMTLEEKIGQLLCFQGWEFMPKPIMGSLIVKSL